jgi:predicted O-linked N-acetylglucosamine transferase (SPINDLY family)
MPSFPFTYHSILETLGVKESVARNLQHYEDLAIFYATEGQGMLKNLKRKMEKARFTSPLFKEEEWVRDYEMALREVHQNYRRGKLPRHILFLR